MPINKLISKIVKKKDSDTEKNNCINLSTLTEAEREIITNTIELKSKSVREIMVPRVDVVMIPIDSSYDKVIKAFNKDRNSRIPVYKDGIDDIVGVLYVKDLIDAEEKNFSLKKILHKPLFVPISISLMELLKNFREKQIHIAMVVDEYGGFSGIVSMEDVLEQIIGDIRDEYDEEDEEVKSNDDGTYLVDARTRIDDFNKYINECSLFITHGHEDHIGALSGHARAFDKRLPISGLAGPSRQPDVAWGLDQTANGSNAFRSTKENIYRATLTASPDERLTVVSDGSQHFRRCRGTEQ